MKIASITLEMRILRTLTANSKSNKTLAKLVRSVDHKCFESVIGKEIYNRVSTLAKQRGIIISWDELQVDPALSENIRKKIAQYKKLPIKNPERLDRAVELLQKYRKLRSIFNVSEFMINKLNGDKIEDIDSIIETVTTNLNDAKLNRDNDEFIDIGKSDKVARKLIRNLLKDDPNAYIPTGFNAFDSVNRGIPRGTFFVVQTNSGGGKSVFANQLVSHAAKKGFRACLVPLEMTAPENLKRHVARLSSVSMSKVIDPKKLSVSERKAIFKGWMKHHKIIKRSGGLLRLFVPKSDMTMEDILFTLQPYNFDLIIVDYIGLLKDSDGDNQAKKLGGYGRSAKLFADKNNMCVGVCAQLNDENKVKYSKAINEHSGLSFSWQYNKEAKESHLVLVELPKSRNQVAISFYLAEQFEFMRFRDIDAKEIETIKNKTNDGSTKVENQGKETKSTVKKFKESKLKNKKDKQEKQRNRQIVNEEDFIS